MFTFKFISIPSRNNAVRLRLVNNRRKTKINTGVCIDPVKLEKILAGAKDASALHSSITASGSPSLIF